VTDERVQWKAIKRDLAASISAMEVNVIDR